MISEYEMVQNVKPLFEKEYEVFEEVKIFTRAIDIVLKKDNKIISIEFKLRDWKKAFEQISDYQIVSDYTYLCIPKKNLRSTTIDKLLSKGIGLFSYDYKTNELFEEIKPRPSIDKVDFYKEYLISKLHKYK